MFDTCIAVSCDITDIAVGGGIEREPLGCFRELFMFYLIGQGFDLVADVAVVANVDEHMHQGPVSWS